MPSPDPAGVTEGAVTTAANNHPITLPGSGIAGDEYIVIMNTGSTASLFNALADWTELLDENLGAGLHAWVYDGAGVPSNPTFVAANATRSAWIAYRIRGADKTTTPQIAATSSGTSATPDPPSLTPTGGVSKAYLSIAWAGMGGEELDDDTWGNTPPSGWTPSPPRQIAAGTAGTNLGGLILAAEQKLTTGAAIDPGTFGVDVSAAWRGQQILVHPAAGVTVSGGVASEADSVPAGSVKEVYTAAPAAETDTVPVGTVIQPVIVAGGRASEAESVPAGKVLQVYTAAAPAPEADSAPAGTVQQVYTAGPASEADSVPAGTVLQPQLVAGGVASETDSVPPGQVQQIYVGGTASEADSARAGSVLETYTAPPAAEADSVPAGQPAQVYTASPASSTESVPAGKVLQIYTAAPAVEADSAPGGTVQIGNENVVGGGVAAETDTVPAGSVAQIYQGGIAAEQDTVPPGTVAQVYTAGRALETDSVPAGTVSLLILGVGTGGIPMRGRNSGDASRGQRTGSAGA